jgi:hypothetical protein
MTDKMPDNDLTSGGSKALGGNEPLAYEPPRLVPVGNLHDLLAGSTGTGCDTQGEPAGSDSHLTC